MIISAVGVLAQAAPTVTAATLTLLAGLIGALAAAAGAVLSTRLQRRRALEGEETTQQRVQRLTSALTEATRTISDIEQELRERQSTVERLRDEIEAYERVRDMTQEEVEAVVDVLGVPLKREARRSFWVNAAMNFGFFVLGAVVSIITTLLIG